MHATEHLGEVCPDCGTHHRVIRSLPAKQITHSALDSLKESDEIVFAEGIMWMSGNMAGVSGDEEVTDEIVLGTKSSAMILHLYDEGWVVEIEEKPDNDETPEERARDIWAEASKMASEAFHDVFG